MTESNGREAMTLPGFNAEASAFKTCDAILCPRLFAERGRRAPVAAERHAEGGGRRLLLDQPQHRFHREVLRPLRQPRSFRFW
jgi:hypothetical protein